MSRKQQSFFVVANVWKSEVTFQQLSIAIYGFLR